MRQEIISSGQKGLAASVALLVIYFAVVTLVSGWSFAQGQLRQFWYYVVTLALGFGIQAGLYAYLKRAMRNHVPSGMVAMSGVSSTTAMVSCCVHYLVNVLPILGAVGLVTVVTQYQVELFWVGIFFNLVGVTYMVYQFKKHQTML